MSKIKDRDYLALTAMLRAREAKMLDRDKMDRMLSASSYADAAKLLTDCGYEDMSAMDAKGVDEVLSAHRAAVYDEIVRMSPQPELVDVFRLKYDYHNAKVVVKAKGMAMDGGHLFSGVGRVSGEAIIHAVEEDAYSALPPVLASAVREAAAALAKTGNPQQAEFILDEAYFKELGEIAGRVGSAYLTGYVKLQIDAANLRAVVRTVRMTRGVDFMMQALIPGGNVSPELLAQAAGSGDSLAALFTATTLQEAAALGAEAVKGGSMTKFELACDNALTAYLASAKLVSFGNEPVAEYLGMVETEITAIRMILSGRLAGIEPSVIRERLRDINA